MEIINNNNINQLEIIFKRFNNAGGLKWESTEVDWGKSFEIFESSECCWSYAVLFPIAEILICTGGIAGIRD